MEIITNLKMNVSVVIPVLNEKESLPELVRELEHSLSTYSAWEVLFIDDGVYFNGSIWNDISSAHFVSAIVAIFMTLIVLATVLMRPKRKMLKVVGIESVLLVICYIFVSIYIFQNPH